MSLLWKSLQPSRSFTYPTPLSAISLAVGTSSATPRNSTTLEPVETMLPSSLRSTEAQYTPTPSLLAASSSSHTGWPLESPLFSGYPSGATDLTTVAFSSNSTLTLDSLSSTMASHISTMSDFIIGSTFTPSGSPNLEYISIIVGPQVEVSIIWPATTPWYLSPVSLCMASIIFHTISADFSTSSIVSMASSESTPHLRFIPQDMEPIPPVSGPRSLSKACLLSWTTGMGLTHLPSVKHCRVYSGPHTRSSMSSLYSMSPYLLMYLSTIVLACLYFSSLFSS